MKFTIEYLRSYIDDINKLIENGFFEDAFQKYIKLGNNIVSDAKNIDDNIKAEFYFSFACFLFDVGSYDDCIEMFINAQTFGYCKLTIKDIIFKGYIEPNLEEFKKIYTFNIKYLFKNKIIEEVLAFEDLKFWLVPTQENNVYYLYDKSENLICEKIQLNEMNSIYHFDVKKLEVSNDKDSIIMDDIQFYNIYTYLIEKNNFNVKNMYIIFENNLNFMSYLQGKLLSINNLTNIYIFNNTYEFIKYFENSDSNVPNVIISKYQKTDIFKCIYEIYNYRIDNNIITKDLLKTTGYECGMDLKYINEYIYFINIHVKNAEYFYRKYNEVLNITNNFINKINTVGELEKKLVKIKLETQTLQSTNYNLKIYLWSVLLQVFDNIDYLKCLIKYSTNNNEMNEYNKFFIYYQCLRYIFVNNIDTEEKKYLYKLIASFYDRIHLNFKNKLKDMTYLNDRDENLIFVFASQILNEHHAPTKVALDTCYNLVKSFNKKVILINTKEVLTVKGIIAMHNLVFGNKVDSLNNINELCYKDIDITFYQPSVDMPDYSEINKLMELIYNKKPYFIITIGKNLVADLFVDIVPTVNLPQGRDEYAKSKFFAVYDYDHKIYINELYNIQLNNLIICKLRFELKEQKSKYTRKELGIPQNKFIIAIVGNRLTDEIDDEFLRFLDKCCKDENIYIVCISEFNINNVQKNKYPYFNKNYKNMGYQEDLLAILENTDIYINPPRSGGGTSSIYSLYLGKPVVTLRKGDVYLHVGDNFAVNNYNEMFNTVRRYKSDKNYYIEQHNLAIDIGKELTDSKKFISDIYNNLINLLG